jgi:hypothetical protein
VTRRNGIKQLKRRRDGGHLPRKLSQDLVKLDLGPFGLLLKTSVRLMSLDGFNINSQ